MMKVVVDAIAKLGDEIILVERKKIPFGLALPGGHLEEGESLEEAVQRELKEETNLMTKSMQQFHTYSEPNRDPRGHYISTVYVCEVYGEPRAGDDAKKIRRIKLADIDSLKNQFAFDHYKILCDYIHSLKKE